MVRYPTPRLPLFIIGSAALLLIGSIWLWHRFESTLQHTFSMAHPPTQVALSDDARYIAAGDATGAITVWDYPTRQMLQSWQGHQGTITALVFRLDGTLLSGSADGMLYLWSAETGQRIHTFPGITPDTSIHELTPEGSRPLAVGITDIAVHPVGRLVASGAPNGHILINDAETGTMVQTLQGHPVANTPDAFWDVQRVAFSPDGDYLASGAFDGSVVLWHLSTHTSFTLAGSHENVGLTMRAMMFDAASTELLTFHHNANIRRWDVPSKQRRGEEYVLSGTSVVFARQATLLIHSGNYQALAIHCKCKSYVGIGRGSMIWPPIQRVTCWYQEAMTTPFVCGD
ncbi:MAG: hypothetical protein AAGF95_25545 [Chloroflexota bacterium]